MLKLAPMLTSDRRLDVRIGVRLLEALGSGRAVDDQIRSQVLAIINETLVAGGERDATPEEQQRSEVVAALVDKPRLIEIGGAASPSNTTPSAVASEIAATSLPARVYIQIGRPSDRDLAEKARTALRGASVIAPGIEQVPVQNVPNRHEVRYCLTRSPLRRSIGSRTRSLSSD
jgi:hypothetical protein